MRFTAKFKKKTCKQLTDDRKVFVNLKKDHNLNNLQKKCPFKDCKYAKYLPKDIDIKLDDRCDLVALYNPTSDRKRDRLKRLQIIAIFIVKSAYGSTPISDLVNLNKRVKRETAKCKTDTSDTEAMQMLCICREFQIVIKKTLKDPALQKKNRKPISKAYDDNQNRLRILEKEVKTHTQNKCSSTRERKTHQRKEYDSMKFCHGDSMDLSSHTEAGDLGSGKVQDHATYTKNAFEHQRVIFNDQTIRLKERHMQVNDQIKRGNCVYISKQDETDELKGAAAKFNNFPGRNHEKELARIKLDDQFKKANVYDKEEIRKEVKLCQNSKILFDQTTENHREGSAIETENHHQRAAVATDKSNQNSTVKKLQNRSFVKNDNKISCKDFGKVLEIRNVRRFGEVNEKHCKAISQLVTHRLNNDISTLSVCVFIQDNLNENNDDLVNMKLEFTNECLSTYFYPGKNIVTINVQKDLKKFLHRTVFQKSSSVKDLFGERHLSSDALNTKAVIMVSQPISALLRHRDICLLDTLHVILGIDRGTLLILKALGKS